jgi:hypothetical protein
VSASPLKYVGIDFSGDQSQWNPNVQASNIWIAVVEEQGASRTLVSLERVQQLSGQGRPFARLAAWLANRGFAAAAIDAPFSVPSWFFGQDLPDHPGLLAAVNGLPLNAAMDFPTGNAFIARVSAGIPFAFTKPLRVTECYWRGRAVNIRSTVWAGARPGAPFASACIKLLANAARPVWPWAESEHTPLIEAFPAAQLRHWGLPFAQYNGLAGQVNRATIVADLLANRGLQVSDAFRDTIHEEADALDAVLFCYSARAVLQNQLGVPLPPYDSWRLEGWIAVHA